MPTEVIERFLANDDFVQRIEAGLDKKFSTDRDGWLREVRSRFTHIRSICELTSTQILGIVKSKKLLAWIESYRGNDGALLVGPTAAGKTISAYAACQLAVERSVREANAEPEKPSRSMDGEYMTFFDGGPAWKNPVRDLMVTSAREIGNLRDRAKLGDDEPSGIASARSCRLLVIDDLGWERPHQSQAVADVLASRYDNGVSTIATSGLSPGLLVERYGDAVIRRALETCGRKGAIIES
ncbi:MAG: hypothetical protein ABFD89_17585 [Bryobacteraceae bacterium]